MATFVELKNLVNLERLSTFKTQMDTKFQAKLDEKEALGTAAGLVGSLADLKTDAKDKVVAAINELHDEVVAAQGDATSALTKIGTLPAGSETLVDLINAKAEEAGAANSSVAADLEAAQAAIDAIEADYLKAEDKTALQTQITTNKNALDVLNGTGEGSVEKQITDAINKFANDVSDDSTVNTFKELVDWAASHSSEAAEMAAGITANKNAIDALQAKVGTIPESSAATTIVDYVDEQVLAEKTRATGVESGLSERIDALEGAVGTGGSVDSKIDTAKSEAIADAKAYTDEVKTALETRVAALETWAEAASIVSEDDILAMFA